MSCTRLYMFVCVLMLPWQSVLEGLAQKNHVTQLLRTPDSVVQAVVRQGERLCAESDPRKGGYPAGYWVGLQGLLYPSAWSVSSKTLGQSQNTRKVSALKTKAVFKLQRHSHQSFFRGEFLLLKHGKWLHFNTSFTPTQRFSITFYFGIIFVFWSKLRGCT